MPVYQLLGGKCREAVDCYGHASGNEIQQVIDEREELHVTGLPARARAGRRARHGRIRRGTGGRRRRSSGTAPRAGLRAGVLLPPRDEALRGHAARELGEEIELLHDVHERVSPNQGVQFCKDAEKFKLFFVEDPVSPEDIAYFRQIRQQCSTPLAMGELFNSPHEWTGLIAERLIDYIRIHVSQAGGLTPCRKIAAFAEQFGVKTAWHGPGDVSPIGHMANVHARRRLLQLRRQRVLAVQRSNHAGDLQGLSGDEERVPLSERTRRAGASKSTRSWPPNFPFGKETGERGRLNGGWGEVRKRDGTVIKQ